MFNNLLFITRLSSSCLHEYILLIINEFHILEFPAFHAILRTKLPRTAATENINF